MSCSRIRRSSVGGPALLIGIFGCLALGSVLTSSASQGIIEGVVTDPGGAEIAGAQVVITEKRTGTSRSVVTTETGQFRMRNLPAGTYQLTASKPLFKPREVDDLVLHPAETLSLNLVLDLEEMSPVIIAPREESLLETFSAVSGRTYYVDGERGHDGDDGLSPEEAWRTIDKVNSHLFEPGDRLLFKAGTTLLGQLRPQGSGSEGKPIIVDMYGQGEKPLIAAEGRFGEALLLRNQNYWEVKNLQLTNTGPNRELFRNGVRVLAENTGTMRHIHLKSLWVHDVNGSLKKGKGEGYGILLEKGGKKVRSRFDNLLIEDCHVVRTDRNGICGLSSYSPDQAREFPSLNVVIRSNLLEDIGGDGIKIWGCDGALVEHNVIRGARRRCEDYAAGIWPWASDNTVIQFNEVSGVKGKKDGQAFDSDAHTSNTIFQYNYSHDNEGGFMLICCFSNTGTIVRYNISQNDQTRLFHMAGSNEDIKIYNNVFYVGEGLDVHLFLWTGRESNWTRQVEISNNVFYVEGIGRNSSGQKRKPINDGTYITEPGFGGSSNILFEKNILYGNFEGIPEQWRTLSIDPKMVSPGKAGYGFGSLEGYRLREDSACIGAGRSIVDNGGRDFWGNLLPVGAHPSIGAHEAR